MRVLSETRSSPVTTLVEMADKLLLAVKHRACIRYRFSSGAMLHWEFSRKGQVKHVEVEGQLALDDQQLMVEACFAGLSTRPREGRVWQHISANSLLRCLGEWFAVEQGLYLCYPSHRHLSGGLRAVIDVLRTHSSC